MPDGTVIIVRPRSVILSALQDVSPTVEADDAPLFSSLMGKAQEGWTEAEAHFMLKHLKKNWHE